MAGVRVIVDKSYQKNAENAVESICYNQFGKHAHEIGETFIRICTPFVPWRSGGLAGSGHVVNTSKEELSVAWSKTVRGYDVARRQYSDENLSHTAPRTAHWDKTAMSYEGETFRRNVERILNSK